MAQEFSQELKDTLQGRLGLGNEPRTDDTGSVQSNVGDESDPSNASEAREANEASDASGARPAPRANAKSAEPTLVLSAQSGTGDSQEGSISGGLSNPPPSNLSSSMQALIGNRMNDLDLSDATGSIVGAGTLLKHYKVVEPISRGAQGRVYLGHDTTKDPELGRHLVAIKIMRECGLGEKTRVQRFAQEAQLLSTLWHPNIIEIYDRGVHNGLAFLVMEYLRGAKTLKELVTKSGPLEPSLLLSLFRQATDALVAIHSRSGLWHRDIKLENLMVAPAAGGKLVLKVLDFGIAHVPDAELTDDGSHIGTWSYMSPEQFEGEGDARSDLYALGVTFYTAATGARPFPRVVDMSAAWRQHHGPVEDRDGVVPPSRLRPDLPRGYDYVVLRLLDDLEHRYQSAEALRTDLDRLPELSTSYEGGNILIAIDRECRTGEGRPSARDRVGEASKTGETGKTGEGAAAGNAVMSVDGVGAETGVTGVLVGLAAKAGNARTPEAAPVADTAGSAAIKGAAKASAAMLEVIDLRAEDMVEASQPGERHAVTEPVLAEAQERELSAARSAGELSDASTTNPSRVGGVPAKSPSGDTPEEMSDVPRAIAPQLGQDVTASVSFFAQDLAQAAVGGLANDAAKAGDDVNGKAANGTAASPTMAGFGKHIAAGGELGSAQAAVVQETKKPETVLVNIVDEAKRKERRKRLAIVGGLAAAWLGGMVYVLEPWNMGGSTQEQGVRTGGEATSPTSGFPTLALKPEKRGAVTDGDVESLFRRGQPPPAKQPWELGGARPPVKVLGDEPQPEPMPGTGTGVAPVAATDAALLAQGGQTSAQAGGRLTTPGTGKAGGAGEHKRPRAAPAETAGEVGSAGPAPQPVAAATPAAIAEPPVMDERTRRWIEQQQRRERLKAKLGDFAPRASDLQAAGVGGAAADAAAASAGDTKAKAATPALLPVGTKLQVVLNVGVSSTRHGRVLATVRTPVMNGTNVLVPKGAVLSGISSDGGDGDVRVYIDFHELIMGTRKVPIEGYAVDGELRGLAAKITKKESMEDRQAKRAGNTALETTSEVVGEVLGIASPTAGRVVRKLGDGAVDEAQQGARIDRTEILTVSAKKKFVVVITGP